MRIVKPDVVSVQDPFLIGFLGWVIARMRKAVALVQVAKPCAVANTVTYLLLFSLALVFGK